MAERGDERDCGGYTRRYCDEQWNLIIASGGEYYWRDKKIMLHTHATLQ